MSFPHLLHQVFQCVSDDGRPPSAVRVDDSEDPRPTSLRPLEILGHGKTGCQIPAERHRTQVNNVGHQLA